MVKVEHVEGRTSRLVGRGCNPCPARAVYKVYPLYRQIHTFNPNTARPVYRLLGYLMVNLPLNKVAGTPFHIQGYGIRLQFQANI